MPENTMKVDRTTKWGNPFVVGQDGTREECVELYRALLTQGSTCPTAETPIEDQRATRNYVRQRIGQLRGHDLACWCRLDQPCHADVLLELANAPARS